MYLRRINTFAILFHNPQWLSTIEGLFLKTGFNFYKPIFLSNFEVSNKSKIVSQKENLIVHIVINILT